MIKTLADQYLAQNAGRRYPFKDDTELPTWLPDSGVLDFRCTVQGVPTETAVEARLVKAGHTADKQAQFTVALTAGGVLLDELVFEVPENAADGAPYTAYASGSRSHGALTVTSAAVPPLAVEYLESTGTQYMRLPAAYTRWDIGLKPKDIAKPAYMRFYAGCMNKGSRTASCYATSDSALEFQNYNRAILTVPCDFYTWHDIAVRSSTVTVDGVVFAFSIGTAAYGSYIFGCDYNGVIGTKCQISYYRAYDENGNVVLDLIPVRFTNELGQAEGAMYDRVSGALHRNQGTGEFVRGDDLPAVVYALDIPFAATTIVCDSLKVHSIQSAHDLADARDDDDPAGLDATAAIDGEIALVEGRNAEPYLDGNRLRLDVFKGAGLGEQCQSAVSGGQRCGTVLFTINGERPGSDGNIRIVGDGGITVTPDPENHAVEIRMDDEASNRMADGCAPACPTYTTVETNATEEAE
jgi:hypothetical protein